MFEIKELTMPDSFEGTYLAVRATQEPGMPVSIGPNGTKIHRSPHPMARTPMAGKGADTKMKASDPTSKSMAA